MAIDIANAMNYLHSMRIIHRDLKCDNLLVGPDWQIKVTDFGVAKLIDFADKKARMTRNVGTLQWVAPESKFIALKRFNSGSHQQLLLRSAKSNWYSIY